MNIRYDGLNKTSTVNYRLNLNLISDYKLNAKNHIFLKKKLNFNLNNFLKIFYHNKHFFNFFYSYCYEKNNFLILNDSYDFIYPIYKQMYNYHSMSIYKDFFFLNPIYFTYKNWSYFFYKFCTKNNINLFFVLDYGFYLNFYKNIGSLDNAVVALIPYTYVNIYSDYPLYIYDINIFTKIMYSSYFLQIFSMSRNYKNLYNQYKFIKMFYEYIYIQV